MMATHMPTLRTFTLSAGEDRTPQPLNTSDAAIHILWLVQTLCWLLVLFL
jgi:hypothetical protein